jgi:hypothetical protein
MRITLKSIMATGLSSIAMVVLSGAPTIGFAQPISDVLTVFDDFGLNLSASIPQTATAEPGSVTITVPARSLQGPVEPPGGTPSDTILISSFTVTLTSDSDAGPGPDTTESATVDVPIIAFADTPNLPPGVSDRLDVSTLTAPDILEGTEPGTTSAIFAAQTFSLFEADGTVSDIVSISPIMVTLLSDGDPVPPAPELAETLSDTLRIMAVSDVPEPASLTILAVSLVGMGAAYRRFSRKDGAV